MPTHLNNDQLVHLLVGTLDPEASSHVTSCDECQRELLQFADLGNRLKVAVPQEEDLPHLFWATQKEAIRLKIQAADDVQKTLTAGVISLVGATLVIVCWLGFSGLLDRTNPTAPPRVETTTTHGKLEDDELLHIQEAIYRTSPPALWPASRISMERNRILTNGRKHNVRYIQK